MFCIFYILTILLISMVQTTYADQTEPQLPGTWVERFSGYNTAPIAQKLGYDPHISLHSKNGPYNVPAGATVYAHGWGDSQRSVDYFHRNANFLPDLVVGFDFVDANFGAFLPSYKTSNFCQAKDIATLTLVLAMLDQCGAPHIDMCGHSRGAGTILTTLARLYRYGRYRHFFSKLGISKQQALRIIEKVQLGTIVLNCPLIDMDTIIKDKLGWLKLDWTSPLIRGCLLPIITKYKPFGDSPLKAAKHISKLGLTTLIYVEQQDMIVGNKTDAALYKMLEGPHTYFCIGNDMGHIHTSKKLDTIVQALYARYHEDKIDETAILDELQPFPEEAEALCAHHAAIPIPQLRIHDKVIETPWINALKDYHLTPFVKLLGYNPAIRVYPTDCAVQHAEAVTVYAHGFGEYQQAVLPFFQLNSHIIPGTIVSFNFPDVIEGSFVPNFKKANVAQGGDIRALTLMLKLLGECGLETIHLFGTSRGGGTVLNMLGRLCNYERYAFFFNELGITSQQAERIIAKIKKGTIVLNCAFIDSRVSARYWFKDWANWILETFVYTVVEHRLSEDQGIESASLIQKQNFNILVHFQHNDRIVGNSADAAFYKAIMGPNSYLVLGNDGGHLHSGKTLGSALQAFRETYGGAYYNDPQLLIEGHLLLEKEIAIKQDVDRYVQDTYSNWR